MVSRDLRFYTSDNSSLYPLYDDTGAPAPHPVAFNSGYIRAGEMANMMIPEGCTIESYYNNFNFVEKVIIHINRQLNEVEMEQIRTLYEYYLDRNIDVDIDADIVDEIKQISWKQRIENGS